MMFEKEQQHPFYKPLWVRVALLAFCAGWFAFELFYSKDPLFTLLSGLATAYVAWAFFLGWPGTRSDDAESPKRNDDEGPKA
jgi:hypothetical protein